MQIIENAYQNDSTDNRLDENCYRDALRTMSQRVNVPEVGELADATLAEMKDRMMIPDTTCYGAAVLAWKNVAMARECDDREKAVRRTMELLEEMTKAFHRTTTVTVKPTTENYNHVLEALTVSKSSKAPDRAEILLSALEGVLHEKVDENSEEEAHKTFENANVGPIAESYKHVLDILRNSKSGDKMNHAIDVLNRMKARRGVLQQSSTEESFVGVYSSFIRVCANSYVKDEEIRMKMMAMALRAVEDMRLEGLQPDSSTYTALLEAGHQLMSDGKDRQKVLENVFLRACEEGYVNQNFLELFKSSASTHLFSKLVVAHSREVEKMKVVPESWTRNVKGFVANVRGGRKVLPLSIEGKFTFTKAASEYKMRKLRMQHNRQMLQGGRTK